MLSMQAAAAEALKGVALATQILLEDAPQGCSGGLVDVAVLLHDGGLLARLCKDHMSKSLSAESLAQASTWTRREQGL